SIRCAAASISAKAGGRSSALTVRRPAAAGLIRCLAVARPQPRNLLGLDGDGAGGQADALDHMRGRRDAAAFDQRFAEGVGRHRLEPEAVDEPLRRVVEHAAQLFVRLLVAAIHALSERESAEKKTPPPTGPAPAAPCRTAYCRLLPTRAA